MNTIFNQPNYGKLRRHCIESFCEEPLPIFSLDDFLSLDKDILFELIEKDHLQINEIIIWDNLIKWGINQIPELENSSSIIDEWTNENHEDLKNTLRNLIPLIRFLDISSDDFYDKVHPYERIISQKIYDEIISYHLKGTILKTTTLSSRIRLSSTIIEPRLVSIMANWIDKNDSKVYSINHKYRFNRIYLKSRDGFDCMTFKMGKDHL